LGRDGLPKADICEFSLTFRAITVLRRYETCELASNPPMNRHNN
jgi:hypothetical protein